MSPPSPSFAPTSIATAAAAPARIPNGTLVFENTLSSSYPLRTGLYQVPQVFRVQKLKNAACSVCRRPKCTLATHRYHEKRQHVMAYKEAMASKPDLFQTSFAKSYAFDFYQSIPQDPGANNLRSLPVPNGASKDLQRSVWSFLTTFLERTLAIPRPANMVMNDIGGAYLVPALTNSTVCFSILSMEAAIRAANSPDIQDLTDNAKTSLQYQQQCLESMREKSADFNEGSFNKDNALALCILWGKETAAGTPDSVRDYSQMVRSMIGSVGGLRALGMWDATAQAIMWVDMNTACCFEEDLWFKDIPAPASPPTSLAQLLSQTVLPAAYDTALDTDVRLAAINFRALLLAKEKFTSNNMHITMHEYRYLLDAINHNNMIRINLENTHRRSGTVDEPVTVAMNLLHLFTLFGSQGNRMTFEVMLGRLKESILRSGGIQAWLIPGRLDILVWICFVAVVTPMVAAHKPFYISVLVDALEAKYGNFWPLNWDLDTYAQLRGFLWLDSDLFGPFSKACQAIDAQLTAKAVTYGSPSCNGINHNPGIGSGTGVDVAVDSCFDVDGALFCA